MKKLNQNGFEAITVLILVLIVAVMGFAAYTVRQHEQKIATNSDTTAPTATKAVAPSTIKSQADLTQTTKALDSSSSELDSQLNDNSLNADITNLL